MLVRTSVVVALAASLAACGAKAKPIVTTVVVKEPVEVKVPVIVRPTPPPELLAPLAIPLPTFVAPSDPNASSALTVEGERILRALVEQLLAIRRAWEAWATAPP